MVSNCEIVGKPEVGENAILFKLKEPVGEQVFYLRVTAVAGVGKNGNLLTVNETLKIVALEEVKGG